MLDHFLGDTAASQRAVLWTARLRRTPWITWESTYHFEVTGGFFPILKWDLLVCNTVDRSAEENALDYMGKYLSFRSYWWLFSNSKVGHISVQYCRPLG